MREGTSDEDVFGETPNTACETHALPGIPSRSSKSTEIKPFGSGFRSR